jgi:predicted metal-binding membrane protein
MSMRRPEAWLAFAASVIGTVVWCGSMSSMPGMEMPGGWTMSMAWMRMPGQSWWAAGATFVGMWSLMMVAMMLPVLMPTVARVRGNAARVAAGYFAVWTVAGVVLYPAGALLMEWAMRSPTVSRAVPLMAGGVLVLAGVLQFSAWKRRQIACCRSAGATCAPDLVSWRHGVGLGLRCFACCAGPTAALLVLGVMDLRAMGAVTLAILLERLAPRGEWIARWTGGAAVIAGLLVAS